MPAASPQLFSSSVWPVASTYPFHVLVLDDENIPVALATCVPWRHVFVPVAVVHCSKHMSWSEDGIEKCSRNYGSLAPPPPPPPPPHTHTHTQGHKWRRRRSSDIQICIFEQEIQQLDAVVVLQSSQQNPPIKITNQVTRLLFWASHISLLVWRSRKCYCILVCLH